MNSAVLNSTVFVRPNLKALMLGGVLLLVVQHVCSTVHSQGTSVPYQLNSREMATTEMHQLLRIAANHPTSEIFMRLSACFEKRGEFRKALIYLRQADRQRESEDVAE